MTFNIIMTVVFGGLFGVLFTLIALTELRDRKYAHDSIVSAVSRQYDRLMSVGVDMDDAVHISVPDGYTSVSPNFLDMVGMSEEDKSLDTLYIEQKSWMPAKLVPVLVSVGLLVMAVATVVALRAGDIVIINPFK
jgi:hypothetical protein